MRISRWQKQVEFAFKGKKGKVILCKGMGQTFDLRVERSSFQVRETAYASPCVGRIHKMKGGRERVHNRLT